MKKLFTVQKITDMIEADLEEYGPEEMKKWGVLKLGWRYFKIEAILIGIAIMVVGSLLVTA